MHQFPPLIDAYTAPRGTLVRAIGASRSGHFIDATGYVVIGARRIVDGARPSTPNDPISLALNERADETGAETTVILPAGGKVFDLTEQDG